MRVNKTTLYNLALFCLHCNGHNRPNIAGIDPKSKKLDLDDGVKINYGKFGELFAEVEALSGAKEVD